MGKSVVVPYKPVAVSGEEVCEYGCPYCGYQSGYSPISGGGTAIVVCGECARGFAVLAAGVTKSTIGFGDLYLECQPHPRKGISKHGKPDKKPEGGGEFFYSRGIGMDSTSCFMCPGSRTTMRENIAAFVQCKAAGERVAEMFKNIAHGDVRLDYREYEPDRVQVKLGACADHLACLKELDRLVQESGGIITTNILRQAMGKLEEILPPKPELPKIVAISGKPKGGWPFREEPGFGVEIQFTEYPRTNEALSLIGNALQDGRTGKVSPDCGHFFEERVTMWFPDRPSAEAAIMRVTALYEKTEG